MPARMTLDLGKEVLHQTVEAVTEYVVGRQNVSPAAVPNLIEVVYDGVLRYGEETPLAFTGGIYLKDGTDKEAEKMAAAARGFVEAIGYETHEHDPVEHGPFPQRHQELPIADISELIVRVHGTLRDVYLPIEGDEKLKPVVPIRRSVTPDYIVCLEDGRRLKLLKRHLRTTFNLTPEEYRAKWGLPDNYPMVAPNYARLRSNFAKKIGLGRSIKSIKSIKKRERR